ncbi:MAG: S9 family peptidase [Gemmatimonadales bacterium]
MRVSRVSLSGGLALLAAIAVPLAAQERERYLGVERYLDYETVDRPVASPDGRAVVYVRRSIDRLRDRWESALWIVDRDGRRNRFLARGSEPVWSPRGDRIAYLAPADSGPPQVFVIYPGGGGEPTQLTRGVTSPGNLRWAPDGAEIGFTARVPVPPRWQVALPAPPAGATWTPAPRLVERLGYKADRVGLFDPGYLHVFAVAATGGVPRDLTPGAWGVGQTSNGLPGRVGWEWMPDRSAIVVEANDAADAERQYRRSDIFLVDLASGERRRLTDGAGYWIDPHPSPNGRLIAYRGFAATRDSYRAHELYTLRTDGREPPKPLAQDLDRTPTDLDWAGNNGRFYFVAEDRGTQNLWEVSTGGDAKQLTTGTHVLSSPSIADNTVFAVRTHFHRPPDLVRVSLRRPSDLVTIVDVNDDVLRDVPLGEVEEIRYPSSGGAMVQGWIVKPPFFELGKQYPLILEIHGGPHGMYSVGFDFYWQVLAASGFVVLYTNPRGSTGYGSAFGNAIDKAYPGVDYDDLMAGVDTVLGRGYVDSTSMFVGGCSGGGILTTWVIGHTTRFRAATVRCPITNWISGIGTSDIPLFGANFFERPFWEDPTRWLEQSPISYAGRIATPTLLMTGDEDLRTPMGQTEELYTALKLRDVPVAMLRFAGEAHGTTSRPSNWMRTATYVMAWYRRWLRGDPSS